MCEDNATHSSNRDEVQTLRARVEQLEHERIESGRSTDRAIAALAHKLNNPLGAILLRTDHAMRVVDDAATVRELLGHIKGDVKLCAQIIQEFRGHGSDTPPDKQ